MKLVPCVAWVSKGVADPNPRKLQLSPEELKQLAEEAKEFQEQKDENLSDASNDENNDIEDRESDDEDFNSKYDLDNYDNEDEENHLSFSSIAVHLDNKDDNYLADEESNESDIEEKEAFTIKETDNLLIVGHVEDDSSILEIYVYNQDDDDLYVHHDIVLPAYPLALEWLDYHPSDEKPGNYIAVGDMTPIIKIWDLDVVEVLEPEYKLGKLSKKRSAKVAKTEELYYHSDAVLSLSWNKQTRNLLASGSADSSIVLWDLETTKSVNQLSYHANKVQALQWHPNESPFLLSGCTDGYLKVYDCRNSEGDPKSWKVNGEVERVVWNVQNSFQFFCSTDEGCIHCIDMRNPKVKHSIQAHKEAVTGLDISSSNPNILISASMDKTMKLWDLENENMIKSWKLKVGSIYTARLAPDLNLTVALGGDNDSNCIKVMDISSAISELSTKESSQQIEET